MQCSKNQICFISKSIHYVLFEKDDESIGGAEIQQKILSDLLVEKGWDITFITENVDNQKIKKTKNGIKVYFSLQYRYGKTFLNKCLFLPISLWRALKEIDAEVYYQRNPDFLSGIIAIFCKIYGKRFVLAGANDWNFTKGKEGNLNNFLDKTSARFAIKYATKIILQNKIQKELLLKNYCRDGQVLHNIFPEKKIGKREKYILWVARMRPYKRPDLFKELAKMLPDLQFVMVGGKGDCQIEKDLLIDADRQGNLSYLGHQKFEKVEKLFDKAFLFVNTSIPGSEGFPNTFLQAWSRGIPVVSFFDLDNLIGDNDLGCKVDSLSEMATTIKKIFYDSNFYELKSKKIHKYFNENLSADSKTDYLIKVLID